ncbi:MAG: zinc ABC transporter substrate-binding protein, partial [Gammaproteobacteria bacterium]
QADVYTQRRDMLRQDLQELDQRIRVLLKDVSPRYLLVQHPAWDYFADAYDFEQISIERDGHEPNARHLVKVIEFALANKLDHVFVQRQYRQAAARIVAEAVSAKIMHLDPLAENYIDNLYNVAVAISQSNNNE